MALALLPAHTEDAGVTDEDRASTLWLRGTIQRVLGSLDEARASLLESLRCFEGLRWLDEARIIRRELTLLALESNDVAAAREYLDALGQSAGQSFVPAGP